MLSSNPTRRTTRRRTRSSGQSLVEFAIVFPVFMLVLAGILDFGFLLYSRMTVINAAREGARAAVMTADRSSIDGTVVPQRVKSVATPGLTITSPTMTITATCVRPSDTCTFHPANQADPHGAKTGDSVLVTVTYQYHGFFPQLFGATINLSSTVQMVLE